MATHTRREKKERERERQRDRQTEAKKDSVWDSVCVCACVCARACTCMLHVVCQCDCVRELWIMPHRRFEEEDACYSSPRRDNQQGIPIWNHTSPPSWSYSPLLTWGKTRGHPPTQTSHRPWASLPLSLIKFRVEIKLASAFNLRGNAAESANLLCFFVCFLLLLSLHS